jgi:acyl-CoA dehydrogenase
MSETRDLVTETVQRIFQDLGNPQTVINSAGDSWRAPLWSALEESGLPRAWVPEELGGAALSISDSFAILQVAGASAVAVPLAETMLAGWLAAQAGLELPEGAATVAPGLPGDSLTIDADGRVSGRARRTRFLAQTQTLVCVGSRGDDAVVALVPTAGLNAVPGADPSDDPVDTVTLDGVASSAHAVSRVDADEFRHMAAAARVMQMAGAMEGLMQRTVDYSMERVAFTRRIAKFQAVQHMLARFAEETAAAVAAANSVAYALENAPQSEGKFDTRVMVEVAAAKIRAGEAAGEGAAIAHQVHGAIGFTAEHPVHRYSQRLWSWRDDFGSEEEWAVKLGSHFAAQGSRGFWPAITAV